MGSEDGPAGLGQRLMVPVGQTTRPLSHSHSAGEAVASVWEIWMAQWCRHCPGCGLWSRGDSRRGCGVASRRGERGLGTQCPERRLWGPGARWAGGKDDT